MLMLGLARDTSCSTNALMAVAVCYGWLLSSSREHERAEERGRRGVRMAPPELVQRSTSARDDKQCAFTAADLLAPP